MTPIYLSERPQSRDELAAWYAEALAEQAASGLSMAAFAEELGVTATTLYHWKRRLAEENSTAPASRARRGGLIEVAINDEVPTAGPDGFVVRLKQERCVEVPRDFEASALQRLIEVLEAC